MTKDEFQAWKESADTRFVLAALQGKATAIHLRCRETLFGSTQVPPEQWAALQGRASFDAGYVKAIEELISLEPEDVGIEDKPERDKPD